MAHLKNNNRGKSDYYYCAKGYSWVWKSFISSCSKRGDWGRLSWKALIAKLPNFEEECGLGAFTEIQKTDLVNTDVLSALDPVAGSGKKHVIRVSKAITKLFATPGQVNRNQVDDWLRVPGMLVSLDDMHRVYLLTGVGYVNNEWIRLCKIGYTTQRDVRLRAAQINGSDVSKQHRVSLRGILLLPGYNSAHARSIEQKALAIAHTKFLFPIPGSKEMFSAPLKEAFVILKQAVQENE